MMSTSTERAVASPRSFLSLDSAGIPLVNTSETVFGGVCGKYLRRKVVKNLS